MQDTSAKTLEQALSDWKNGALIAVAEYRTSRAETITWRDRETQRTLKGVTLTHSIEVGGTTTMLSERVPDEFDPKQYQSPFTKGENVLVHIDSITRNKGVTTIYGKLEKLDSGNSKPKTSSTQTTKP